VKLSVAVEHFAALVRKAKFAFNKTLHITFEVWLQKLTEVTKLA